MKRLIIFDLSNFIFRAFFAIRSLSTPEGVPVNAVYGVLNMILKAVDQYGPTHLFVAKDSKKKSFRHKLYSEYKANRSAPPEDLIPQFKLIDELVERLKMPELRFDGYEADDIIGSVVTQFADHFDEILIASSDKDLMQFANDKVKLVDTMKGKVYGPDEVFEKMGVRPDQVVDYLTLVGDTSDNVPGVKGIGAKGAAKLLAEFDNLENVFKNVEKIKNKRVLTGLTEHREAADLSKKLITIDCEVPLEFKDSDFEYALVPDENLKDFLARLNFKSTIVKLFDGNLGQMGAKRTSAQSQSSEQSSTPAQQGEMFELLKDTSVEFIPPQMESFFKYLKPAQKVALIVEENNFSVTTENINFTYQCLDESEQQEFIKKFLSQDIVIYTYSPKAFYHKAYDWGLEIKAKLFDVPMAHFNIDTSKKHDEKTLNTYLLQEEVEIGGEEFLASSFLNRSKNLYKIAVQLENELDRLEVRKIFEDIDLVLNPILASMEHQGVKLDCKYLENLEKNYSKRLEEIQAEIFEITEMEINLKSPKQVSELLFEKLGLPIIKKTKTGASTDSSVLNTLSAMGQSPIPDLILQYREIDKLVSTYISVLPGLVDEKSGRLHTHFNQSVASTGRLSSENPNLQNIPIKTENGRRIRKAFIADPGHVLLSADYSQVELRILAHFCRDDVMVKAFKDNLDIHAQTAAEVFGVDVKDVTKELRGRAKAINFGLIYGQSSFGLADTLGISRTEAKEYITHYFQRFSKVKAYLDSLKEFCEEHGYAQTLMGRKRFIPDINSKNRTMKGLAERMAINSPIQGTAADIIKIAMINLFKEMQSSKLKSTMILQVHDELIFEVPEAEIEKMQKLVRHHMENAVKLSVPLKVDMSVGEDWYNLK
ncbi:MAG: DNA polymerase I [Halobacteriovoraceae bacterium]|nr:DNA polymerase I [Halobacteriovoraceae bacterium]